MIKLTAKLGVTFITEFANHHPLLQPFDTHLQ